MHAQEQEGGHLSAGSGVGVGEGPEPLPGEPLGSGASHLVTVAVAASPA